MVAKLCTVTFNLSRYTKSLFRTLTEKPTAHYQIPDCGAQYVFGNTTWSVLCKREPTVLAARGDVYTTQPPHSPITESLDSISTVPVNVMGYCIGNIQCSTNSLPVCGQDVTNLRSFENPLSHLILRSGRSRRQEKHGQEKKAV